MKGRDAFSSLQDFFCFRFLQDNKRLFLWSPVAIGTGTGIYFSLDTEPGQAFYALWAVLAVLTVLFLPSSYRTVTYAVILAGLGMLAADWRTRSADAPLLLRETGIVDITGRLVAVEEGVQQRRLLIEPESIGRMDRKEMPERIRVTWRGKDFNVLPGDTVSLKAGLKPPPLPVLPGGFDFARQLYFRKIGAVGFAVSEPVSVHSFRRELSSVTERLRLGIFRRITQVVPGESGAVIAAIATGKRDGITPDVRTALRDAGLAHLLAISGLHMGLATGLIFFSVRFALACVEPVALRVPVRKWAAVAALVSGAFYLAISGGGWSARRAFIMAAIMFAAILADRRALSLRNVSLAACLILLMTPEALFHPGFQMSFAAVTTLIACYEWLHGRRRHTGRGHGSRTRIRTYVAGLVLTDLIAAVATAPYALYHFNRTALYSLPANVVAMPLMGFWIMPFTVIALCLSPSGLDAWAWKAAAYGMDMVLRVAGEVSSWPGAVMLTPRWPLSALLVLTSGGLWLCLCSGVWRLAGLLALPAALVLASGPALPSVIVAGSGKNAGVYIHDAGRSTLAVYSTARDRFALSVWMEKAGLDPEKTPAVSMRDVLPCDPSGCSGKLSSGLTVSFIEDPEVLYEDCARADIVVAFFPVDRAGRNSCDALLIDRRAVWNGGAHVLEINEDGNIRMETVSSRRGRRPWTGE